MANEEQRRAFASYMGTAGAGSQSPGLSSQQFPATGAHQSNPYLFNVSTLSLVPAIYKQYPGLVAPPAAPTPPPAAPSSVVSYPGSHIGQNQSAFLQRPPPLGYAEAIRVPQHISQPVRPHEYGQVPRYYNIQPPPAPDHRTSWQYMDPMTEQNRRLSGAPAAEILESKSKRTNEQSHYHRYETAYGVPGYHPVPQSAEQPSVPVMLCHTCSHCGRLRSVGFHRNHPVLPGKPLVSQPCRRCTKKFNSHCRSSYTRIRSCTADVPCDWPAEPVCFDVDRSEGRGRRRYRDEFYEMQSSPGPRHIVQRSSSQMHMGLGALQQPCYRFKTETRVRVSSLSPRRYSSCDEVWPPPDVVTMRPLQKNRVCSPESESVLDSTKRSSAIWPPPDVVHTPSCKKAGRSNPRLSRVSSRIIELSPSPSPPPSRSRTLNHRNQSSERRSISVSPSPIRVGIGEKQRSKTAGARITAHSRPYRPVLLDNRYNSRCSDMNSSEKGSVADPQPSLSHRRRTSRRSSPQSIAVEVGGPRVQFSTGKSEDSPVLEPGVRMPGRDEGYSSGENYNHFHRYSRRRYINDPPTSPTPPIEEFEELRFRPVSPLPCKLDGAQSRASRSRRLSSSPPIRSYADKASSHHTNSGAPPSPQRRPQFGYRYVSRPSTVNRPRTLTPPLARRKERGDDSEDITDSDSAASGEITEVRSWKGIDENGKPATFVEEKKTVKLLEPDKGINPNALHVRVASKSWRDV